MLQLEKNGYYAVQNKRKSLRKASLTPCVVEKCFFESGKIYSRSINYSDNGCMLEMDYPLSPGDAIKIYFTPDADETKVFGKNLCLATVRWCKTQDGSSGGFYGVGVEVLSQTPRRRAY